MSVAYPLPGTRFHAAVKEQLGEQHNWIDSDDLAMLYRGPHPTSFYRQLHFVLHQEFRLRRTWQQLRRGGTVERTPIRKHNYPSPSRLKALVVTARDALTLPIHRIRLDRLGRQPFQGFGPLGALVHPPDSAHPSPQPDE
jgi:anaerobic magnesium-protoporphyrin IX monomethyl ester cyclase